MARRLGLGQSFDFGLAQQSSGLIPTPGWKLGTHGKPWVEGETMLAGIGQGFVLTTPLQLAVMTARVATGREVVPRLVLPGEGEDFEPPPSLELEENSLTLVHKGLLAAVNEAGGTGHVAQLPIAGVTLAGKTGTAQVSRLSRVRRHDQLKWRQRDHSLFVGYAPAEAPRYSVAAIVEHAGSGSKAAAPLVRDVMSLLFQHDKSASPPYRNGKGERHDRHDRTQPWKRYGGAGVERQLAARHSCGGNCRHRGGHALFCRRGFI